MHDSLTGLPNRLLLMLRSRRVVEKARDGEQAGLLLLDLDHFKQINDTLGHHVGDELLRLVAGRLRSAVRDGDTVARFGGDEFAVLCPGLPDAEAAEELAQRLVEGLTEPFALEQISLHVGASIGIALLPMHADDVEQLVQRADIALYQAKAERATTRTYDSKHDFNSVERLALMEELRAAMDTQLVLHYQPKCRASDGAMVGVEALVRWQHPERGLLYPDKFLPGAENSGLIVPMTMLILREALQQVRRWQEVDLFLNVAVNISPRHLADVQLPGQVKALLEAEGLPGSVLTFEVTENSIMSDPARAAAVLRELRGLGIGVSIDDFGTGYSSLAYLRDLSATEVKIDMTFVMNASTSPRNLAIVKAAADLGHSLGLLVVAEGIEDTTTAGLMVAERLRPLAGISHLEACSCRGADLLEQATAGLGTGTAPHAQTSHRRSGGRQTVIILYACLLLVMMHVVLPGSDLRRLGQIRLRHTWLVWLALADQIIVISILPDLGVVSEGLHLASYALAALVRHPQQPVRRHLGRSDGWRLQPARHHCQRRHHAGHSKCAQSVRMAPLTGAFRQLSRSAQPAAGPARGRVQHAAVVPRAQCLQHR